MEWIHLNDNFIPFPRSLAPCQWVLSGYVSCHDLVTGCEQSVNVGEM